MTSSKSFSIVASIIVVALCSFYFTSRHMNKPKEVNVDKGFVVVELFTSEGCSSCPPADDLINRIQKESNDIPVYILAYHVDYWNRLGWKDVFSNPMYSKRQRQYAGWLHSTVYTPQAVVNGSKQFVGSKEGALRNAIKEGLQTAASSKVTLHDIQKAGGKITLQYNLENKLEEVSLLLALVEKNAVTKVLKGENAGRDLVHAQIVRDLQTIDLKGQKSGAGVLQIAEGLDKNKLEVIAFMQDNNSGQIIAATKAVI
jgi:hypothetical protein